MTVKYSRNDIDEIAKIVRTSMIHFAGFILSKKEMNDIIRYTRQNLKKIVLED